MPELSYLPFLTPSSLPGGQGAGGWQRKGSSLASSGLLDHPGLSAGSPWTTASTILPDQLHEAELERLLSPPTISIFLFQAQTSCAQARTYLFPRAHLQPLARCCSPQFMHRWVCMPEPSTWDGSEIIDMKCV